jgi:threonine synthase
MAPELAVGSAAAARRKFALVCLHCGTEMVPALVYRCPDCAGALEARFALGEARPRVHVAPERAYFDYLPVMSSAFLEEGLSVRTPCRPVPALGAAIGVPRLWVKDETGQPTGSTKDRLASVVLAVLRQFGVTEFVASSTGNSSTALARAVRRDPVMRAHFFCGRDFESGQDFARDERVTLSVVDGGYVAAGAQARAYAEERGLHLEGGFFNWARREGLKIAYLEAVDEMGRVPDVVVQAISSGMGILAAEKGIREYLATGRADRMPRFLMVQEASCAPMAAAWRAGRVELTEADVIAEPSGLATAILLGDGSPYYPYLADIAARSGGSIVAADADALVRAHAQLRDLAGIDACYASAATIAAVSAEAAGGRIDPGETVLVNLTGKARDT